MSDKIRMIVTEKFEREGNDCLITNKVIVFKIGNDFKLQIDTDVTGWTESHESESYDLINNNMELQIKKYMKKHNIEGDFSLLGISL